MNDADRAFCESVIVAGNHEAKYNTFDIVEKIVELGVAGDFAEAGVGGGGQIAVMDKALQKHGDYRRIHAFDSFDGICKATAEDDAPQREEYGVRAEGEWLASTGKLMASDVQFWNNMDAWGARKGNIRLHPGWFQDSLPFFAKSFSKRAPSQFALLRIDVDLVDSVRTCVKWLYPMVVTGGFVIFDDWGIGEIRACRDAFAAGLVALKEPLPAPTEVDGAPGTVWWRKP